MGRRRRARLAISRGAAWLLTDLGRHSFELFLLILCASSGLTGLLAPDREKRSPVDEALPSWVATIWYGGLTLGALIAIGGILAFSPFGRLIERSGLLILTGLALSFSCLVIGVMGAVGLVFALILWLFAWALLARVSAINREPREIRDALKLLREMDGES